MSFSGLGTDFTLTKPGTCTTGGATTCGYSYNGVVPPTTMLGFTLKAKNTVSVAAGSSKTVALTVAASDSAGNNDSKQVTFQLNGPAAASTPTPASTNVVPQVSGVAKDIATGQPVGQAQVQMKDDALHQWATTTNAKGQFTFRSTTDKPIVPGTLIVGAIKDGFQPYTRSYTGTAGKSITTVALAMTATAAAASAGATVPTPVAGDSGAGLNPGASVQAQNTSGTSGGGSSFSLLLIVLGALLVLLGIGAIVLILLRRKDDGGDADADDGADIDPRRGGPMPTTAIPASHGAFHAGPPDATMVARGAAPDAPTEMLQRTPPLDEFPDPYNAPLPPHSPQPGYAPAGGYGQGYQQQPYGDAPTYPDQNYQSYGNGYPSGGYGDNGYNGYQEQQAPGYGNTPRPPAPVDPYAAPDREYAGQGYGNQYGAEPAPRASEPTGMFDNYDQTYDQPRAGNGGGYPAYPPPGGQTYGSPAPAQEYPTDAGYANGGGVYGGGQDYEQPGRPGYDPPAGYEPGGGEYGARNGYPQAGGYEARGGYGGEEYGATSRHSAPAPQAPRPGPNPPSYPGADRDPQRRQLDWLDD